MKPDPHLREEETGRQPISIRLRGNAGLIAAVLAITLFTVLLRAVNLQAAYDIFLDEITYLFLAESVAENLGVRLHGETFYLHPPLFFYLEGAFVRLFQPMGEIVDRVYAVRTLNVALAGASGAIVFLLGRAAAGPLAGLLAALIYALDPLSIRLGSRNMLEVAATFWVLVGLLVIMPLPGRDRPERTALWRIVAAGILFGLAILTKDMMVFLSLLPLAICFLLNRGLSRRTAISIGAITVSIYAVYPLAVWLSGDWARFVEKKTGGVARLIGLVQETGFNRPVAPGLLPALIDKLGEFGPTYLIFVLGGLGLLYLWWQKQAPGRLLAIWAASAYALLAYLIPLGTLETQFFYYLLPLAVLTSSSAAVLFFQQRAVGTTLRWFRPAAIILLGIIMLWSLGQWVQFLIYPDNGYQQALAYVNNEIPAEASVSATSETAQFLLDDRASGPWGSWVALESLAEHRPDYLIISERQLEWDYGQLALPLLTWLEANGQPVFLFEGRTNDRLVIFYLPPASWNSMPSVPELVPPDG